MSSLVGVTNFLRTVRAGSFAAAARELNVSAVAVSKNVAALERELGARLLNRSTRALSLTEEGRIFFERCDQPLREIEQAFAVAKHASDSPTGLLRVTCLSPIGRGLVVPLLRDFGKLNPSVQIDLRLDDTVIDMVAQGVDVGIRVGNLVDPAIIARKVSNLPFVICAAPAYFAQYGVPKTVADLSRHNCLRLSNRSDGNGANAKPPNAAINWRIGPAREAVSPEVNGTLIATDFNALEQAALNGIGLFHAPLPLVAPHFRSGLLRPVLPSALSNSLSLYIHYRSRRNQPARMKAFVEFMTERLRSHPDLAATPKSLCTGFWV
jgi:LysR family transcriptional regulator, transcriptional activator for dmlA